MEKLGDGDSTENMEGKLDINNDIKELIEDSAEQKNNTTEGKCDVTEATNENQETLKPTPPGGMSKNQMKKLLKRQRWLDQKHSAERKAYERQKRKNKRLAKRELGEPLPPSRKHLKKNTMKNSACKVKVAIDCSFDSLMSEKDISQLVQQLNHAYAANRRVEDPVQFYITGLSGQAKKRLDDLGDYKSWDVYTREADYMEEFAKNQIVYLTSESPNILSTLSEDKVYIIGGLVDHNHQKGLCYSLAQEKGIAHAQLPISDYIQLKTRKVLTINHVFEILVQFTRTNSWEEAFFKVIPSRKLGDKKVGTKDNKINELTDCESKPEHNTADTQTNKGDNVILETSSSSKPPQVADSSSSPKHQPAISPECKDGNPE